MTVKLSRMTLAGDLHYAEAMELYAQSFPYHEQREPSSQTAIMEEPAYHFDLIFDEKEFVGIILSWQTEDSIYIEHFCIMPKLRGCGYGRQTLALFADLGKTVILEIDPPVDEVAIKRKRFYESVGYVDNPFYHVHPPYHCDHKGHELVVMSYPEALSEMQYQRFNDYLRATVMK